MYSAIVNQLPPLPPGLPAGMAGIALAYALLSEYVKGRFFEVARL